MKKLVLFVIVALLVATPAFAGAAEDEAAITKVLETFRDRAAARDAHGMADLFAEDGMMKYFYGANNEAKSAEGRMKIYIVFSFGNIVDYKVSDIKVTKVDGNSAEAIGKVTIRATAFGANFRREPEVAWQLKRVDGSWMIYLYELKPAPLTRE